jgi:crotonobetainyl-CoA:carnitine CoA-transferase CaiB-like acyl-CoA transferase
VKVVDLGLALAGPYGSSLLADLGADVIKVNARWDGPWMSMGISGMANRGKRSAMLDLRDPLGKQAVYELVKSADIVTHNMRNGVVERMGISYDDLIKINPSIIYCESRGFDRVRSATNIPGTDQSGSALAGQEWEDGGMWNGGKPFLGTSMGDLGNGFLVAIACTQALYHRDRTGEGQFVGTSILNACLATSSYTYVDAEGRGAERPKLDKLQLGLNSLYRLYETAEGWVCVAIVKPKHWQAFCDATGRPELATDERFADAAARAKYDEELGGILEEVFTGRTAAEWFSTLDAAGVPIEISAQGMVTARHDQPFLGFSATPAIVPGASPVFGAHTREILLELGTFTDEQIDNLTEQALAASAL